MKKHSTKSGKAAHANPQPQQAELSATTLPAEARPNRKQMKEALKRAVAAQVEQFNRHLGIARAMWRENRRLVEAKTWPEPFRTLHMEANNGEEPGETEVGKVLANGQLRLSREYKDIARSVATGWANGKPCISGDELSPAATNLMNERGAIADPPTTTYLLLAQHFEDGKELEFLQEVELSYDENWKLRRYVAELRGLIPAKDVA
jgi:hypothetical protein